MGSDSRERLDGFMRLLLAYQGRLYEYLRTVLPRSQEIDDILQETFLVMWEKYDESCPPEGFYPWACRIARFKVLESFARTGRDMPGLSLQVIEQITADEMTEPEFLADIKLFLHFCLNKLSERDRELIEWRYEPNARVDVIATRLGRPVNSVSKSLGRIRQFLRRCIDDALKSQVSSNAKAGRGQNEDS